MSVRRGAGAEESGRSGVCMCVCGGDDFFSLGNPGVPRPPLPLCRAEMLLTRWAAACRCLQMSPALVAPPATLRRTAHHSRALAAGAATLALCLCVAVFSAASSSSPERTMADKLLEVRASTRLGHYVENGRVHYFQQTAVPSSAYFNPAADEPEYRAASTSGLGFAGGGDPYKYIRTGHYAKILAAEHDVEQGWSNGTTYHSLGAMTAVHGRMQELASASAFGADIKSRDEAMLALLSAPVSTSQLRYGVIIC